MSNKTQRATLKPSSGLKQNNKTEKKAESKSKEIELKGMQVDTNKIKPLEKGNRKRQIKDAMVTSAGSSSSSATKEVMTVEKKKSKEANNNVSINKEKPSKEPATHEDVDAIDDMFSQAIKKKRLNEQTAKAAKEEEEAREKRYKQAAMEAKRETALFTGNPDPQIHRWDKETGLPVYKYYDLRMGEAGSGFTPLCPFDCSCCF